MRIVVLDGYTLNPGDNPWDEVAALGEFVVYERSEPDEIVPRAIDAEIVLTNKTLLPAEVIEKLPKLKMIGVLATGFNVVDVVAARKRNIPVCNVPEYGTDSVAQFVIALLMELCHRVGAHDASIRTGEWARRGEFSYWLSPTVELTGRTMGILGFGRIGRRVGELAHAFGMNVLASNPRPGRDPGYRPFGWCDVKQLFAESDAISLHCPLTESNKQMVNRALLATMKPNALLINTARGGLVNEQDLTDALNQGQIAGAALDVVSTEPIASDNPLLHARNCILTPHLAWATLAARKRLMATVAKNIAAFIAGQPINVVN